MPAVNQDIAKLVEDWQPKLRDAFLEAVAKLQDRAQVQAIADALARGDVDGAVAAVGLEPAVFRPLDLATSAAFDAGGEALAARLSPVIARQAGPAAPRLAVVFDARNIRAEGWLRKHSSKMVTEITNDQREVIRQHLQAGMAAGQNPKTVALDLVGRINPTTRKREGGVIGLTSTQAAWARRYEAELLALKPEALLRSLRDKRFDKTVQKAIKDGKPLPKALIAKMVTAYRSRALKFRGDTIGRTEAIASLSQSQNEAMQQAIDKGKVQAKYVTKTWDDSHDTRVRHTHRLLRDQTVPFDSSFKSSSGASLRYPGDPDAPPEERINCRCHMSIKVDFIAQAVDEAA